MREVRFRVNGLPVSQGSKVMQVTPSGRAYMREDNAVALRRWRREVRTEAEQHRLAVIRQSPLSVTLGFWLPCPQHAMAGDWCPVKPDIDKLTRAVLDALTGPILIDDAQVVELRVRKRYGTPGVRVTVRDAGV